MAEGLMSTRAESYAPPAIKRMIDEAIDIEVGSYPNGGYTNDPADPGGETKWGVTKDKWKEFGVIGPGLSVKDTERWMAFNIFWQDFVIDPGYGEVALLSNEIASELVESSINLGPNRPGRWLQRVLNVMNQRATLYADIGVDGAVGPNTLNALRSYMRTRDPRVITMQLNHLQGAEYQRLAEAREEFERFAYGWVRGRTSVVEIPGKLGQEYARLVA